MRVSRDQLPEPAGAVVVWNRNTKAKHPNNDTLPNTMVARNGPPSLPAGGVVG